jgi:hypothetical protein
MHIALVGGLDRSEAQYRQLAERAGHSIEWHTGDLAGRGSGALESIIERSDLVIVVTAVNSHGAVWRARKLVKLRSKRLLLLARCGVSKFGSLLSELSTPGAAWKRVSA